MRKTEHQPKQMERPFPCNAVEVRAILEGRKTQKRCVFKPQPAANPLAKSRMPEPIRWKQFAWFEGASMPDVASACPYGRPGDRLWVRETWCHKFDNGCEVYNAAGNLDSTCVHFAADGYEVVADDGDGFQKYRKDGKEASPWKSPYHMPRWASRITLEITKIRVERLINISHEDAIAEGVNERFSPPDHTMSLGFVGAYIDLWDSINGVGAWDKNPWVFVLDFIVKPRAI